eukprot:scaffold10268_cov131-Skeletonema_marinoi.AAC.1
MANCYGTLEAVDCYLHSVRYDMVLECIVVSSELTSSGHLRRCSDADTSNKCFSREKDASIIMANYYGSLEAVDCHIHSVTYDVAATPIRRTNA